MRTHAWKLFGALCCVVALSACTGEDPSDAKDSDTQDTDVETDDTDTDTDADVPEGVRDTAPYFDPISLPKEPTLDINHMQSAADCATCHPTHFEEWRTSNHAYAMVDPVYRALVDIRQVDLEGQQDGFCTQCHTPVGVRSGDIQPNFDWEELDAHSLEGVTCTTCHQMSEVVRPSNAGFLLDLQGPMRGPINDPVETAAHEAVGSSLTQDPALCGSCHDAIEVGGLELERPYAEWTASPSAEAGQTCQDCHMPERTGQAATMGPERTTHLHRWVGVDVPFLPGFLTPEETEQRAADVETLLKSAASVHVTTVPEVAPGTQLDVVVTVRNEIPAHSFPTGSTFLRQAWLELVATDATGRVLYETGTLDANADLRDRWSALDPYGDSDLIAYHSGFVDGDGAPTIFTHKAAEHTSQAISPLYDRTSTLFVPVPEDVVGPVTVTGRVRFRAFGPYLLRAVGLDIYTSELRITDIDMDQSVVSISAP